jgi:hypothetical protein
MFRIVFRLLTGAFLDRICNANQACRAIIHANKITV